MKRIVIGTVAALATTSAMAAPTIYGKINKELRFHSQEDVLAQRSSGGVTDVDGSESRMGVKGSHDVDGMNVKYKLEIGLNSSQDGDAGRRDRIRKANVMVGTSYGTWTIGRATTADRAELDKLDAFSGTSAASVSSNTDLKNFAQTGSVYRSRAEMLGYTTPNFMGLTLNVSMDGNTDLDVDATDSATWYQATAVYARELAGMNLRAHATKAMEKQSKLDKNSEQDESEFTNIGFTLGTDVWGVGFRLGMENEGKDATTNKDKETDHMLLSGHYMMGKHKLAVTYRTSKEDYSSDKLETTQISAGMICKMSKHVSTRIIVQKSDTKKESDFTGTTLKELGATSVITGIQVKF